MKGSLTTLCVGFLCGLVIYKIFKWIADDDVVSDAETSDYTVTASVANRLEELYGGTAYVGLRIPDPETRSLQNIDIVLVKNGEEVVISVKNFSGLVSINNDGSWVCMGEAVHPNPVDEVKNQASILESYLEQRGIPAGERCLSCKVILPNTKLRPISLNLPEVITYDQLTQLKPDHPKLNFILQTAPMWDRLQLEGNKFVLGEFLEFKGDQEDTSVLSCIERSKVSCLFILMLSMFGSSNLSSIYGIFLFLIALFDY
ncbi:uncharacterized protein LOC102629030 isoform X1 [Citrus sinensis]|uniref:uncharacterized protein LOC102629030 isoform X1 n=1 Tax=Citrus sinensis TaxID=2711 RepID=UPI0003D73551|nr:uncharacterized protein LOC102629030 isoform X1 [Citrus sinensis]